MNKKYPIDTPGRIKAAWAYIHQPRNAEKYTRKEEQTIKAGEQPWHLCCPPADFPADR